MSRFTAAAIGAIAGTTVRPSCSLYNGSASKAIFLRRVWAYNTTATFARYTLVRLTAKGTPGAAITPAPADGAAVATATPFLGHTADLTGGQVVPVIAPVALPANTVPGQPPLDFTQGQFGRMDEQAGRGLIIPAGVANGVGLVVVGTGQVLDAFFEWDEF